jgi:hypothetical protein
MPKVSSARQLGLALCLCLVVAMSLLWLQPADAATLGVQRRLPGRQRQRMDGAARPLAHRPAARAEHRLLHHPCRQHLSGERRPSTSWTDYSVEASVFVPGADGGAGIIGRAQDRNHFYLLQLKQLRRLHGWLLHRRDGTRWVDIATGAYPWVQGVRYNLKLDLRGSVLAPVEVCAERDVKGLYAKALAGQIEHFTGISDPYEPPLDPELVLRTDQENVEESARLLAWLEQAGLTPSWDAEVYALEDEADTEPLGRP